MQKALLERFISKYNLAGKIETVKLVSSKNSVSVECCDEAKTVFAFITASQIPLDEGEFVIFETSQFRSLLGVLSDEISIDVKTNNGTPTAFAIGDENTKVVYALAEPKLAPETPRLKHQPPPNVSIVMNRKFMETFVRARGALSSVEHFTVVSDGVKTEVVLGYEEHNTNNVTIHAETTDSSQMQPTHFIASSLKDIILANKEATTGMLHVSDKGFARVTFEIDGFTVQYFLLQQKK